MTSASYLIIFGILTSGYLCLKIWNLSYYRIRKFDGQELFLACGAVGTFVLLLGSTIHTIFQDGLLHYVHIFLTSFLGIETEYVHSLILGFGVTGICILLFNNFLYTRIDTVKSLIRQNNDGLELLLLDSMENTRELAFSLNNGKVYIGLVITDPFSPLDKNQSFKILPLLSGYRDENKKFDLNTDYTAIYEAFEHDNSTDRADQFSISLSTKTIVTCSYFDLELYEKFK